MHFSFGLGGGLRSAGVWAGLSGLGWAGLGWAGLGWAGLGWAGLAVDINGLGRLGGVFANIQFAVIFFLRV